MTAAEVFSVVPTIGPEYKSPGDAWLECVEKMRDEIDEQIFSAYIAPLQFSSFDESNSEITIRCPSKFITEQIDSNYKEQIKNFLESQLRYSPLSLKLVVDKSLNKREGAHNSPIIVKKIRVSPHVPARPRYSLSDRKINSRYTFDNFIVGSSNQFCHAAARRVAENPGKSYNPLFIYGGVGLGKTHLLHAIGNYILSQNPDANVLYMSAEMFVNELILSLRNAKMEEFKNKFRSVEALLIDDIQFITGKERTQEEFFHTFNALYNAKHQIVITSDKIPQEIDGLEERLRTRFSWGLTADLQAPDFETRVAILNKRAHAESFELPKDVAHLVAESISSNVRELEGALTRVHALSSLQGSPITMDLAHSALKPLIQPRSVNISISDISKVVALHFNLKVSDLSSKRRTRNLSFPRHIAMYLCRKHTTCSYPEIGENFGGRDHSSVIHAATVVSEKIKKDANLRDVIGTIEKRFLS